MSKQTIKLPRNYSHKSLLSQQAVQEAQGGKIVMYVHTAGNVALISWKEYERLKKLDNQPPSHPTE